MDKIKLLLAFSWGHQYPRPGTSNEMMAKEIVKVKNNFDYFLAQIEISEALIPLGMQVNFVVGKSGEYINTYEVAKAMKTWISSAQMDPQKVDVSILCHKAHWSGLRLVLKKLEIPAHRVEVDVPYDPESSQWYTRGPMRAFIGKVLHAVGYLLRGELF